MSYACWLIRGEEEVGDAESGRREKGLALSLVLRCQSRFLLMMGE